jgi:hypothetical protein
MLGIILPCSLPGAPVQDAQITKIIQDVRLVRDDVVSHAALNDSVPEGTEVRTTGEARAELTFGDQTIARLGPDVVFSFKKGTRQLSLGNGAVLVEAPKKARAQIHAAGLVASISGTTAMFESNPSVYKFLVLQGTARLYRPGHIGDSVLVQAGQLVIGKPNSPVSDPVDFDIGRFVKTSRFITEFQTLRSESLMAQESRKQERDKSRKRLIDTNLVIFGGGSRVTLVDPSQADMGVQSTAAPGPADSNASQKSTAGAISTLSQTQGLRPKSP